MWNIVNIFIVAGILICALQAIRERRLLISALWLAGTSALISLLSYLLGAPQVAVIELSVGAGLVTILFVFAINITGKETLSVPSIVPKPLAWALIILAALLLGWMILTSIQTPTIQASKNLNCLVSVLWGDRSLDILLQVALIFSGVLGVLGLLSSNGTHQTEENEQ